jgi:hypothetical protein
MTSRVSGVFVSISVLSVMAAACANKPLDQAPTLMVLPAQSTPPAAYPPCAEAPTALATGPDVATGELPVVEACPG